VDFQESLVKPISVTFDLNRIVELLLAEPRVVVRLSPVQGHHLLIVVLCRLYALFANSFEYHIELVFVKIQTSHASDIDEVVAEDMGQIVRVELSPSFLNSKALALELRSEFSHQGVRRIDRCLRFLQNAVLHEANNHGSE